MYINIERSWKKFIIFPWLITFLITIIYYSFSYLKTESIIIFLGIIAIILMVISPYLMLKTAPQKPYLCTILYSLIIWIFIKLLNFDNNLFNNNYFNGLFSGIVSILIAILIYFFLEKNNKTLKRF